MKISHEVPIVLLEDSLKFNDYLFCLPHLMDESEEYRNFFLKAKKEGWYIIMDNSLHELGEAYNSERLLYWLETLKPSEFIVPDVWKDYQSSVVNARRWKCDYLKDFSLETTLVAVVQGDNLHEVSECYKEYKELGFEKIAFTYGLPYYNQLCPHPNVDMGKALGRIYTISVLNNEGIISSHDRIHLLGCAVPQEFSWYDGFNFIESIDTSNPIMAALDEKLYINGLKKKPLSNLNSTQWLKDFTSHQRKLIDINTQEFKRLI